MSHLTCSNFGHIYPPINFMLSFMGRGQLGTLGNFGTFSCYKKNFEENPDCNAHMHVAA